MDAGTTPQQGALPGGQGFAGGPPPGGRPPGGGGAMMFLGPYGGIVTLALLGLTYVVLAIAFWQLLKKAGLTPAVALLMLVPGVNLGVALWAAFTEWPITEQIGRMRLIAASAEHGTAPVSEGPQAVAPMPGTTSSG